ncbi:larval cuticle protein LCP-17-like [Maniola jurtina]|uniref:larval cuticle protein LCP-17-like n=1 Tax=Maniola jurtina TaxID=191418 RepID=UPI001E68B881|nr:larval cuticle protein LCP-17-like [Maniola jurtina]
MKTIIVLSLVALALAGPQSLKEPIPILRQESNINPDGSFQYSYETGNSISASASGSLKNIGAKEPALQIQGEYQYRGDDGIPIALTYVADENGYNAQGSAIPTSPPIPADIQRALKYLATAPPQKE